jgi:hypothetical protein
MIQLQPSMLAGLSDPSPLEAVRTALQNAVQLEHSTIPPYLYALYSLRPGRNVEIAEIIESVVVEEMLHMTLACNVLNALGGAPVIDDPSFVPDYPGPLPGGVEDQLVVHLAPFSDAQLEAFITIEAPADPSDFPSAAELAAPPTTIGEFYEAISQAIGKLGDRAFTGSPANQVGPDLMPRSVVVTDTASAQQAINIIVEQGEGTSGDPAEVVGPGYAHYYRYMQIQKGRQLVPLNYGGPAPEDRYAYQGAPVPFDRAGVYPLVTDPGATPATTYTPGTAAALANDSFNYTYTSLLKALHILFNGAATQAQFNRTLGLMMSLKGQAKAMMGAIPNIAEFVGPTFVYQAVNPTPAASA